MGCDGGLRGFEVGGLDGGLTGAEAGEVLAVAGAVDVEADGGHGEAIEDGGGDGGVAEVLAPRAEFDVRGDRGRPELMPAIDQVPEHVGGGRGVAVRGDLAEADVVEDDEFVAGPAAQAGLVGAVGEAGVEVGEEVDEAGVADQAAGDAGAQGDGTEDVALAGAGLAGDDEVLLAGEEAEAGELLDDAALEAWLEVPVEGLEGVADGHAAVVDPALAAALAADAGGVAEHALEELGVRRMMLQRPREVGVEVDFFQVDDPEDPEVSEESSAQDVSGFGRRGESGCWSCW